MIGINGLFMWSLSDFSNQEGQGSRTQMVALTNPRIVSISITLTGSKWSTKRPEDVLDVVFLPDPCYNQYPSQSVFKRFCQQPPPKPLEAMRCKWMPSTFGYTLGCRIWYMGCHTETLAIIFTFSCHLELGYSGSCVQVHIAQMGVHKNKTTSVY